MQRKAVSGGGGGGGGRENSNSNCLLYIGHRPLYKQRFWGVGGMQSSKVNEEMKGGGGGYFAHTENYQFCTTAVSPIPTLTIKKLFSFVCGMKNKL